MKSKRYLTTVDAHAGGGPLRIVTGGFPAVLPPAGREALEHPEKYLEPVRQMLMREPRGHADMAGAVILPPADPDADFGIVFMHAGGYSALSGHGVVAAVTAVLETGFVRAAEHARIVINTPAGTIEAEAECTDTGVRSVAYDHVPSRALELDRPIEMEGRRFSADIAYSGAVYALVEAEDAGLSLEVEELPRLRQWGVRIARQLEAEKAVRHPLRGNFSAIDGVVFAGRPHGSDAHVRNVVVFADGRIDRSPSGTGMAALMAVWFRKGKLAPDRETVHESITGSRFSGRITRLAQAGSEPAVIARIQGRAFLTGTHQFLMDPTDPFPRGFLLR